MTRPAHRPQRDPLHARVSRSYHVHPRTAAAIAAEAKRAEESQGQVLDRICATTIQYHMTSAEFRLVVPATCASDLDVERVTQMIAVWRSALMHITNKETK